MHACMLKSISVHHFSPACTAMMKKGFVRTKSFIPTSSTFLFLQYARTFLKRPTTRAKIKLSGKPICDRSIHNLWETVSLSEVWIKTSEKILDHIKRLEEAKERDRLELVSSLRFVLSALQRSLLGWIQWVNNPDIMTRFTKEELEEVNKELSNFTRSFIEYDLEATKLGAKKGLRPKKKVRQKKEERPEPFYV